MKMIAFALLAAALASPAVAGDKNKQQTDGNATKKPHMICKRDQGATGSHMSPLVCKTAEEWQAMNEAGNGKLGTMARGTVQGSGQTSFPSQ
jgi:hypothetical protein